MENFTASTNVIEKCYAEKLNHHQPQPEERYLLHHGVYHPQKNKLRVVFDCAATFQGTLINGNLLRGPNLSSTPAGTVLRFRLEKNAIMGDIENVLSGEGARNG